MRIKRSVYRFYRYLYFILFFWLFKMHGKNDAPVETAAIGLSLNVYLNIMSVLVLIEGISRFEFLGFVGRFSTGTIISITVGFLLFNNFLFVFGKRYQKIIKEFHTENLAVQRRRIIYGWCYIVGSPLMLFISWTVAWMAQK